MKKDILAALVFAAIMLVLAAAAKFAHAKGYIDANAVLRILGMNGLIMVYFGNQVPKRIAPNACARQAMRFSGWAQVLGGLTYAGLWAFAPIPVATILGTLAVLISVIATLGYCVLLDARTKAKA